MIYAFAVITTIMLVAALFLLFFGLPGTWVMLVFMGVWAFFVPSDLYSWRFFLTLGALATVGEVVEFLAGHFGAKKYGGSNHGSLGGMVGALVGGIMCAPLFFGLGALLGVFGGAFLGCFLVEITKGKTMDDAAKAAWGVTLGRFGGFIAKMGLGIVMLWMAIPALWASV